MALRFAIFAKRAGAHLALNELAETRADLLAALFPETAVTRFDAAQIDDHLDPGLVPSVVLMNPPFSALAEVEARVADAAARHVASALARLAPGGRLVAITGAGFAPDHPTWAPTFARLQERGRVVFSAAIDGAVYARHGTAMPTRLTVIDKLPAEDPMAFPATPGVAPDVATLLGWIERMVPPRLPVMRSGVREPRPASAPARRADRRSAPVAPFAAQSRRALRRDRLVEAAALRADRRRGPVHPRPALRPLAGGGRLRAECLMPRSDIADLAARLGSDAEAVCRAYLSAGRRVGRYWIVGDVRNAAGRSMFVRLSGPARGPGAAGRWRDAATGEHGDLLDVIREALGLAGVRDAAEEARRFLGLPRETVLVRQARQPRAGRRGSAHRTSICRPHWW